MDKNYLMQLENDIAMSIRVPRELRDLFNDFCRRNLLNSSAVIRSLMIDFMNDYEKGNKNSWHVYTYMLYYK